VRVSLLWLVRALPLQSEIGSSDTRESPAGKPRNETKMHIIVCSKTSMLVEAASRAFESRRPRITVCESGLEVLGAVQVVDPDLLILDMRTPGLNGLLMISAIRELAPNLPIVAVSATPQEDARALSHKGVSYATLPSGSQGDGQALVAALAQIGDTSGSGISAGVGSR